jgi:hypothetical protein
MGGVNLPDIVLLIAHTISAPFNAAAPLRKERRRCCAEFSQLMSPVKNLASSGYACARDFCLSVYEVAWNKMLILVEHKKIRRP